MRAPRVASSLLALLAASRPALGEGLSDVPPVKDFLRRGGVSATVIGDYVYIDGGEMSQLLDGLNLSESGRVSVPVNSTISIDISKSWTSSNAVLRPILRPWASKANQIIWTDKEKDTFYVWGGKWIRGANMTANELWKFAADGSGGGSWSKELPANPLLFNSLQQYEYGVSASTNTTGFSIGGVASGWTKQYRASNQVITGMVAFDMNTKLWYNGTTEWSPFNTITAGSAHWVPNYGPNGLVMVFGGISMPIDNSDWPTATPLDFRNITFFDPDTKEKYTQVTTGDVPSSPRVTFCVTGFENKGGGYEIFLFGGYNDRDKILYGDAYVLSLPGFVWTKLPDSPDGARRSHSCLAVGNRQVLSIGGTKTGWDDVDSAPQGLTVFDMVDWKWRHSYDAKAKPYVRAPEIKKWYADGSLDSVKWSSDAVRELFVTKSTSQTDPNATSSGDAGPSGTGTSDSESSSSTPIGPIVGGVVGGLAAIALCATLVWCLIRRRAKGVAGHIGPGPGSEATYTDGHYHQAPETLKQRASEAISLAPQKYPYELNSQRSHAELTGNHYHPEHHLDPHSAGPHSAGPEAPPYKYHDVQANFHYTAPAEMDATTPRY